MRYIKGTGLRLLPMSLIVLKRFSLGWNMAYVKNFDRRLKNYKGWRLKATAEEFSYVEESISNKMTKNFQRAIDAQ